MLFASPTSAAGIGQAWTCLTLKKRYIMNQSLFSRVFRTFKRTIDLKSAIQVRGPKLKFYVTLFRTFTRLNQAGIYPEKKKNKFIMSQSLFSQSLTCSLARAQKYRLTGTLHSMALVQVNLCLCLCEFLHQLTRNMMTDCSLNCKINK